MLRPMDKTVRNAVWFALGLLIVVTFVTQLIGRNDSTRPVQTPSYLKR